MQTQISYASHVAEFNSKCAIMIPVSIFFEICQKEQKSTKHTQKKSRKCMALLRQNIYATFTEIYAKTISFEFPVANTFDRKKNQVFV